MRPAGRDPLRPDRARLVELRLEGVTVDVCASRLGRDRATLFRWLVRPDVKAALAAGQARGRDVAAGTLAGLAPRAAEVLGELMADADSGVRFRAAARVLELVGLAGDIVDASEDPDGGLIVAGVRYRRVEPCD